MSRDRRDMPVLLFAMIFPSIMGYLEFMVFPHHAQGAGAASPANLALQILFPLGKAIQFALPVVYMAWVARAEIGWPTWNAQGIRLGVLFGVVVSLGMFGLYFGFLRGTDLFKAAGANMHSWLASMNLATPARFFFMAFFISILHSGLEEYYWRWFVFGRLERWLPTRSALVVAGLAFMAHHVVVLSYYLPGHFLLAVVPFSLCVAVGGVVWAWLYRHCGSLAAPWISHALIDLALMAVGYDLLAPHWQ